MKKSPILFMAILVFACSSAFVLSKNKRLPKEVRRYYSYIGKDGEASSNGFFIMHCEVANYEYQEFLNDLKTQGKNTLLASCTPNEMGWQNQYPFLKDFDKYYFSHPAYANYPVVNITYEAALEYCNWLTQKHMADRNSEGYVPVFRLPEKSEWMYAAESGVKQIAYSWGGPNSENEMGCPLGNFKQPEDEKIGPPNSNTALTDVAHLSLSAKYNDHAFASAPVGSYAVSKYGLYNINGNVAEMTTTKGEAMGGSWNSPAEECTNQSVMNFTDSSPMVGFRVVMTYMKPM
jgi:sulfatase modifying factor 1